MKVAEQIVDKCSTVSLWVEKSIGNDPAAYLYGILAELVFFFANLGVLLIDGMDSGTAFMLRGISTMMISLVIADIQNIELHLSSHLFKIVTIRNLFVGFHLLLLFICVGKLPFSLIYIIEQTTPIWVFLINYFQYGLPFHLKDFIIFFTSLFGVFMISFPEYIQIFFSSDNSQLLLKLQQQEAESNYLQGTPRIILILLYSLSIISFSFGLLFVKQSKEPINVIQIIFNQGFIYFASGAVYSLNQKNPGESFQLTFKSIFQGMMVIGFFSYIYQIMYLRGTIITSNHGKYSLTGYSAVIFAYLYEIILLGELPNLIQLAGLVIVIGSLLKI